MEGDYKNPPLAGKYTQRFAKSREIQRFDAAVLLVEERKPLGRVAVKHLKETGVEVIAFALGGRHLHLQMRCPQRRVIETLGALKRKLWYARRERGNGDRLWGGGRKIVPIESRKHQCATLRYILKHRDEGAWVWCFRDGDP